jgi:mono/diheme cytochrome c family protein
LQGSDTPKIVQLDRLPPAGVPGLDASQVAYAQNCGQCHGLVGGGSSAPPLARQSQLADPELLKLFLQDVLPPMPHLYPGVLDDDDVKLIAKFLRKKVFNCGPDELQRCKPPEEPHSGGTFAWKSIYSVLTSPRCINCHTIASKLPDYGPYPQDYPRQGDDRHPHYYGVLRGDLNSNTGAGIGTPVARCISCHGANNDPVDGIPGAHDPSAPDTPVWSMAPAVMTWETAPGVPMNGNELCAQIKDPKRNGKRTLHDVMEHISNEPLVNWAWHPGTRLNGEARTIPPISQQELVQQFSNWMQAGAPCPADGT